MDPAELTVYADLIQILGSGEAACLSLAQCRSGSSPPTKEEIPPRNTGKAGRRPPAEHSGILTLAISSGILTWKTLTAQK